MKPEMNKKIASLIDGELNVAEQQHLLAEISQDPELMKKMNRYHSIGHVIKTSEFIMIKDSFLSEIQDQIEQEPHHFLPKQNNVNRSASEPNWKKVSYAVAASAILFTVLITNYQELKTTSNSAELSIAVKSPAQVPSVIAEAELEDSVNDRDLLNQQLQHERLKAYLQAQNEELFIHDSAAPANQSFRKVAHE